MFSDTHHLFSPILIQIYIFTSLYIVKYTVNRLYNIAILFSNLDDKSQKENYKNCMKFIKKSNIY